MAQVLNRATARHDKFENYLIMSDFIWGNDVVLEFCVIEVSGEEIAPTPGVLYVRYGDGPSDEGTHDPCEADIFLSGSIKWDGCSNWNFAAQDGCMLHFCGEKHATSIGRLMQRMYEITRERMPKFDLTCGA